MAYVRGSHFNLTYPTKPGRVTVPRSRKGIRVGTLRNNSGRPDRDEFRSSRGRMHARHGDCNALTMYVRLSDQRRA